MPQSSLLPKLGAALVALIMIAGCQTTPPVPTLAPTEQPTGGPTATLAPSVSPSPTASPAESPTPFSVPTLRPMVTATGLATPAPVVEVMLPTPLPGPLCFVARPNDTLGALIFRSGYDELTPGLLEATRALNGLPPGSNAIVAGQQYCIPRPTPTPTPPGYEATQTVVARELPDLVRGPIAIATYVIKEGENIITVQLNSGATLREICTLNDPTVINCAGCDLTKPIGQQGCRPIVVVGRSIKIPGPTPTPTITPTVSGNETATPTPAYDRPSIVSPINGAEVFGVAQLIWLPVRVLEPDEFYMLIWSDLTRQQTWQHRTRASTYRLPRDLVPAAGEAHTVNWQVGVAREGPDGSYVLISPMSLIYSFTWRGE